MTRPRYNQHTCRTLTHLTGMFIVCLLHLLHTKAKALHQLYFSPRVALPVLHVVALQSEQVRRERICTSSKPSVDTAVNLFHSHAPAYCCCCYCCYCEVCYSVAFLFLLPTSHLVTYLDLTNQTLSWQGRGAGRLEPVCRRCFW